MQTIVALGTFEANARDLLGDKGFDDLVTEVSQNPKAAPLIEGTGGLRKMRAARPGQGKRGGARVIYYYINAHKPILLVTIYAKADKENLTAEQKRRLKKLVEQIIDEFG